MFAFKLLLCVPTISVETDKLRKNSGSNGTIFSIIHAYSRLYSFDTARTYIWTIHLHNNFVWNSFSIEQQKKQLETFIGAMKTAIKYYVEILIRFDFCFMQKKKQITKPEYQNQNKMQNHKRWNSLNRILTSLKTWPISLEHNLWFLFLVGVLIKWTRIHANCRFQLKIVYRCVVAPRNSCEAFINRDFIYRETAAHTHWIETHSLN